MITLKKSNSTDPENIECSVNPDENQEITDPEENEIEFEEIKYENPYKGRTPIGIDKLFF